MKILATFYIKCFAHTVLLPTALKSTLPLGLVTLLEVDASHASPLSSENTARARARACSRFELALSTPCPLILYPLCIVSRSD